MSLACLDTLVGLSPTTHDCFTDSPPSSFDTSDSGYFLTDQDFGLSVMNGVSLAGWGILQAARAQAIREFKTDLLALIMTRYDSGVKPFSGYVGQLTFTASRQVSNGVLGYRIRTRRQKGLRLVLEKCMLGLDTSGTYPVSIKSNNPLFESPADLDVIHTAGSFNGTEWPTGGISLPLWADSEIDYYLEYYIAFHRNGATPLNNRITCCGAAPGWMKHIEVAGFESSTLNPINQAGSFSTAGMGMALKAYLTCESLDWLCELKELGGYYFLDVAARIIQQRSAAIAASALIEQPRITVGGGFDAAMLNDRRNFLNSVVRDRMNWIIQNLPKGVTDCFKCKPENKFHKSKLLV